MTIKRHRYLFVLALLGTGCQSGSENSQSNQSAEPVSIDSTYRNLPKQSIEPINEFAVQTLRDMAGTNDTANAMISPWSAEECFGMIRLGAKGQTDEQLKSFLHQNVSPEEQAKVMSRLRVGIANLVSANIIRQANGIWVNKNFSILPKFVSGTRDFYKAESKQTDFPEPGLSEINSFVSKETNQLIPKLFDSLNAATMLVLVNAISFKDRWDTPFEKSMTKDMIFRVDSSNSPSVATMSRTGKFSYGENEKCQWLNLPYRTGLRMLVLLPTQGTSLQAAIEQKGLLEEIDSHFRQREGTVWIPKWKSNFDWNIKTWMNQHGLSKPYDGSADFSGISSGSLSLSQAIQKTYIQVDEVGTTAAAATGEFTAAANHESTQEKPFEFKADHPFAYFIWAPGGVVYFAGLVRDPTK